MNITHIRIAAAAALIAAIGSTAPAQPPAQSPAKRITAAVQPLVENQTVAGAVMLVADKDKTLSIETAGYADLTAKSPMRPDNLFWIASMTKPITATAILMLQEEGKLSVDDPVTKYLPELANLRTADGKSVKLTLRHLLTHTSGMAEPTPQESKTARTLADLIPHFAEKPLLFEPGSKWQYCQSGINSLGRIIEVESGQSLPEFFQKRIFDPLGMKDTTFYPTPEQLVRLAKSYKAVDGRLEEAPIGFLAGREPGSRALTRPPTAVCSRRPETTPASAKCSSTRGRWAAGSI